MTTNTRLVFAMVIALAAVFAIASPVDSAVAQTSNAATPDGEEGGEYKDGENKDGKSCPFKERKAQEQSS